MMNVYKSFQSYLGAPDERSAELKGIGSILSEVDVEAKQSSCSSQSLRRTLSADMLSQGWMSRENSLRKSCSFYELSRKSYSECEEFSDLDSEDRSEEVEEEEEEVEDGDIFPMTDEEEREEKDEVVMDKNCGDLWSLIQSEKKQEKASFFALMAPSNKELKVDSSKWEPCKPYVHPSKRKSPLSDQSLRLCTESLGCESGTDCSYPSLSDTDDCSSASSSEDNSSVFGEEEEEEQVMEESISAEIVKISDNVSGSEQEKTIKRTRSFPPPLSSIARTDGPCIHMRSYKQDGRLLLKAVPVETSQKYLTAHREDGRLQLHLIHTELQKLSPKEEKVPADQHEFNPQKSKAEEKKELLQQKLQQSKCSAFSNLSNFRRHVLRSEYQNPSSNKELTLNLNMNSSAKGKSLLLKNEQVQGSNRTCSKEMNSFSKVTSAAAAAYTGFEHLTPKSYTGCEDFLQERPSQSLITTPPLLYYKFHSHYSAAGDLESKSLPKFPCNENFRRCQVRQWLTKFGEPHCIAISS